jgi:DNA-binding transcriptional LysR family regulator
VDYVRLLSDGDMDLVIANWDEPPEHLHMSKLFEDPIICVMRADCPYALRTASDKMTLDDYLTLPHVAPTQILPGYHGVIDDYLERQGLQRNVMVESAYFGLIPNMLAQTDPGTDHRQPVRAPLRKADAAEDLHGAGQIPGHALLPAVARARASGAGAQMAARTGGGGAKALSQK